MQPLWKVIWGLLRKFKNRSTTWSSNLTSGYVPKEMKSSSWRSICCPMFTEALITVAKTWKQYKCPLVDEWRKKMWYTYTMEYYLTIQMKEILPFLIIWTHQYYMWVWFQWPEKGSFWCLYWKNLEYIGFLLGIGEFPKNKPAAARVSDTQASPVSVSNSHQNYQVSGPTFFGSVVSAPVSRPQQWFSIFTHLSICWGERFPYKLNFHGSLRTIIDFQFV